MRPRHNVDCRNGAIPAEQADLSRRLKIPVARFRWQVRAQRRRPALFRRGVHGGDEARFSSARRLRSAARGHRARAGNGGPQRGTVVARRREMARRFPTGKQRGLRRTGRGRPTRKDAGRRFSPVARMRGALFQARRLRSAARGHRARAGNGGAQRGTVVARRREMVERFPTGKQRGLRRTGRGALRERMPAGVFPCGAHAGRAFPARGVCRAQRGGLSRVGGKWWGAVRDGRRVRAGNGGALSNRKTARIASHRQGCPTRKDAGRRFPLWRACGARFSSAGRLQSAARGAVACGREMVERFPTGKQRALRCTGRSAPRERMPDGIFHRGAPEKRGAFSAAGADALRRFPRGEPVRPPLNPGISVALLMPQPANPCRPRPNLPQTRLEAMLRKNIAAQKKGDRPKAIPRVAF